MSPLQDAPALIEVWRGPMVESRHHAHIAVVDARGRLVRAAGDVDRRIYGRSSIKPLLAISLVESGAAARFGLTDREIALAAASHNGEPGHVEAVLAWLARLGLGPEDLECGAQAPSHAPALRALHEKREAPTRAHNNCSGKHAGFLTTALHLDLPQHGYIRYEHPLQQRLLRLLEEMAGTALADAPRGIDGCGIPVIAFTIRQHALAMARLADPGGLAPARAEACRRIVAAMTKEPWHVAGTQRFCTLLMQETGAKAAVKVGAEGVYTAALPELGLGVCLKVEDGAGRAAEVAMGQVLAEVGVLSAENRQRLEPLLQPPIRNWAGTVTGKIAPAPATA